MSQFATAFSGIALEGESCIAAAVSGGGDSTALLLALKRHLDRFHPRTRLVALTVDHRLRPESAAEAKAVAALCARLGVPHRTLPWTGDKPATGLAEAARLARHRLLADAAHDAGARLVLTGHTADDQAETVAMRGARGPGTGLAGMAPATLFEEPVWFVRPFVETRRAALRDLLHEAGVDWIEDPSNADPARERTRVRAALARTGDTDRLIAEARQAGAARRALMQWVGAFIDAKAETPAPGLVRIDPKAFAGTAAAAEALRLVAATVGGRDRPADFGRALALAGRIRAGERLRATLAGAVIDASARGVFLHREWRGAGPIPAEAVDGAIFDGRYRVVRGRAGATIRAAGTSSGFSGRLAAGAARAEPVLEPPGGEPGLQRVIAPYRLFLPDFDLAAANALARLFHAREFGDTPWRGHNDGIAS